MSLCNDCPPVGYPTDKTRCLPCPRRAAASPDRDGHDNLTAHNAAFDRWERMTPAEREAEIKWALR